MDPTAKIAASAYENLARLNEGAGQKGLGKVLGTEENSSNFSNMVEQAENQFSSLGEQAKTADNQMQAYAAGKADLVDVVTAVSQTELALETIVSVRDKVISAYNQIMSMPI